MMTETDVMGINDFVGSVGGSLGLFLGFSAFSYIAFLIDKLFDNINDLDSVVAIKNIL